MIKGLLKELFGQLGKKIKSDLELSLMRRMRMARKLQIRNFLFL